MSRGTQGTGRSQQHVAYGAVTLYGRPFQTFRLCCWFLTPCDRPYNPAVHARRFGLLRVRSPLLAESLLFSLPGGTEMVHFPPLPSHAYGFSERYFGINQSGFPHSDTLGSKLVCSSPRLIAAYRVLHRLLAPRHSPYALSSLTTSVFKKHCVFRKELPFAGYSVVKELVILTCRTHKCELRRARTRAKRR